MDKTCPFCGKKLTVFPRPASLTKTVQTLLPVGTTADSFKHKTTTPH